MANRSDDFNRADSALSLGTPSDAGSNWTTPQGTWGISSNRAYNASQGNFDVATLQASASDVEVQVTVQDVGLFPGLVARCQDANNWLIFYWDSFEPGGAVRMYKNVAGSLTSLGISSSIVVSDGDVLKFIVNGSALDGYVNGVLQISTSDSAGLTNTLHGLMEYANGGAVLSYYDTFSIVDNTPAPGGPSAEKRTIIYGAGPLVVSNYLV